MGSELSRATDKVQSELRPRLPTSYPPPNARTTATTTSTPSYTLPHNPEAILKDADTVINNPSPAQLYEGFFLNQKRQKYWVDKGNCFLVFARDLSITWGEDSRYWQWTRIEETSVSVDVAELLDVCWLEVRGTFDVTKLTPGLKYEVVFVVKLKDPSYGWKVPINVKLILPDGNKQEHKEKLMEKPKSDWFEIPVGEFMVEAKKGGCIEFSLYEYEDLGWKRGLVVKGAAIRPKK